MDSSWQCPCGTVVTGNISYHQGRCPIYKADVARQNASGQAALLQTIDSRKRKAAKPAAHAHPQPYPWLQQRRGATAVQTPVDEAARQARNQPLSVAPSPSPPPSPIPSPIADNADRVDLADVQADDYMQADLQVDDPGDNQPRRYNLRRRPQPAENVLPQPPVPIPFVQPAPVAAVISAAGLTGPAPERVATEPNSFGLWKQYEYRPSTDPDDLIDETGTLVPKLIPRTNPQVVSNPFANLVPCKSHELLLQWHVGGSGHKSLSDTEALVNNVLRHPEFRSADFKDNTWKKAFKTLGGSLGTDDDWFRPEIQLDIPLLRKYRAEHGPFARHIVKDFMHRKLCGVIRHVLETLSANWTFDPYKLFVTRPDGSVERVYGEVYWSDEIMAEHARIQQKVVPESRGGALPRCLIGLMFGSDATHLSQFGTASAWPGYLMFMNQSKYERARPSLNAVHHIANFTKLPDEVQDFIKNHTDGASAKRALLSYCKREVMHKSWEILLDDDFLEAYEWGMVVLCADGVRRLCFPRIITYSADYPEKALIACIKDKGDCLCPRCLIPKSLVPKLGQRLDARKRITHARKDDERRQDKIESARRRIVDDGISVDSTALDFWLKNESLVPVSNAFSKRLAPLGFDFHKMFTVDMLHEFLKGKFEQTLVHMIRVLYAFDKDLVAELDERFRLLATFGRSTIRKFHNNVSELKRLAARDFEVILLCAIPPFESLLLKHSQNLGPLNDLFMDLLFVSADWHASCKFRMHTTSSAAIVEPGTADLGALLRRFQEETADIPTKELPREFRARQRRNEAAPGPAAAPATARMRKFNMETYKTHALGYYGPDIVRIGTIDNYDTHLVEMSHRRLKRANKSSNRHDQGPQLAAAERRAGRLQIIAGQNQKLPADTKATENPALPFHIAKDERSPVDISYFTHDVHDPATKDFLPQLKSHILERLGVAPDLPDERYSEVLQRTVVIVNGRLFLHRTMRINYTTYDMRRDQDSINPRTSRRDVMFLSLDERRNAHPYWYARVLSIFHVYIQRTTQFRDTPKRIDCLWIRWFGEDPEWRDGWARRRLPRVGFVPSTDPDAFGFLDPATVLRACYLMPTYSEERTQDLLPYEVSAARREGETDDWVNYYVAIWVDRDMYARYRGGGVGHRFVLPTRENSWFPLKKQTARATPAPAARRQRHAPRGESSDDAEPQARAPPSADNANEPPAYNFEDDDESEEDEDYLDQGEDDGSITDSSDDCLGYDMDDLDADMDDVL